MKINELEGFLYRHVINIGPVGFSFQPWEDYIDTDCKAIVISLLFLSTGLLQPYMQDHIRICSRAWPKSGHNPQG